MVEKQKPKKVMPISPGRPKGVPNKINQMLKDAILQAADEAGGKDGLVGYLRLQAMENPGPFMGLLGKIIPMQVTGDAGGAIVVKWED